MSENKNTTKSKFYNKPYTFFSLLADVCNQQCINLYAQTFSTLYTNSFLTSFSLKRSCVIWYSHTRKEMDSFLVLCLSFGGILCVGFSRICSVTKSSLHQTESDLFKQISFEAFNLFEQSCGTVLVCFIETQGSLLFNVSKFGLTLFT